METLALGLTAELILFVIGGAIAIPGIKKELKRLNINIEKATAIQEELVKQVIRNEERLDNHIADTHIHNK